MQGLDELLCLPVTQVRCNQLLLTYQKSSNTIWEKKWFHKNINYVQQSWGQTFLVKLQIVSKIVLFPMKDKVTQDTYKLVKINV